MGNAPEVLQSFVDYLNDMLDKDHDAVRDLMNSSAVVDPSGDLMGDNNEIKIHKDSETGKITIRLLGFFNGWILSEYDYVIRAIVEGADDDDEPLTVDKFELMEWQEYQDQLSEGKVVEDDNE